MSSSGLSLSGSRFLQSVKGGTIIRIHNFFIRHKYFTDSRECSGAVGLGLALIVFLALPPATWGQKPDWFQTGTGMGVQKARVAVADFAPASPPAQPLGKEFSEIVRADLDFSGIIEMVSTSMYPTQVPSQPSELNPQPWSDPPASTQ